MLWRMRNHTKSAIRGYRKQAVQVGFRLQVTS